jgi:hypothetical protein
MALTMSDMAGEPETGDLLLVPQQHWGGTAAKRKENGDMIRNIEIVCAARPAHADPRVAHDGSTRPAWAR